MLLHYIFFTLHLIGLSFCADRYHKHLKKLAYFKSIVNHPQAKKEVVWKELDKAKLALKKNKRNCFLILGGIWAVHQLTAIFIGFFISRYKLGLPEYHWIFPIPALILSALILLVIFWLRGKGGGIPRNTFMERFGGTSSRY